MSARPTILVLAPESKAALFLLHHEAAKVEWICNNTPPVRVDAIVLVDQAWESPVFQDFCSWWAELNATVPPLYRWLSSPEVDMALTPPVTRARRIDREYYTNLLRTSSVLEWSLTSLSTLKPVVASITAAGTAAATAMGSTVKVPPLGFADRIPLVKRLLNNWKQIHQPATALAVWKRYETQWNAALEEAKANSENTHLPLAGVAESKRLGEFENCRLMVDPDFLIQWLSQPNIGKCVGWTQRSRESQVALLNDAFRLIAMSGQKYLVRPKEKIPYNIICLERRMNRNRAPMESQLEQFSSWLQPNFIPAVDGLELKRDPKARIPPQLWNEDVKKRLNFGQTGCSLSHLGLWAPKPYKGWELEGEDDFFVGPTFGRDMPALVAFVTLFAAALDSMGIDVILTGYHIAKQLDRWAMLVNLAPKVLVPLSRNSLATIGGAFGYFISEAGRKRFYDGFTKLPRTPTVCKNMDVWMLEQEPERQLTLNVPIILSEYYNNTAFRSDLTY